MPSYYANPKSDDRCGVIAPWYRGLNGQLDERLRIAVAVYKRCRWVGTDKAVKHWGDVLAAERNLYPEERPRTGRPAVCGLSAASSASSSRATVRRS